MPGLAQPRSSASTKPLTKLTAVIKDRLRKRVPDFVAQRLTRKFARGFFQVVPEFVVTFVAPGESDDYHVWWEFPVGRQVIQGRDKFAMSEITGGTENYDATWLRHGPRG